MRRHAASRRSRRRRRARSCDAHVEQEQEPLRGREREILALVAAGHPNKIIARRLGISEKTVKSHLTSVYRQIGVTDRVQAALWARDHGITAES